MEITLTISSTVTCIIRTAITVTIMAQSTWLAS